MCYFLDFFSAKAKNYTDIFCVCILSLSNRVLDLKSSCGKKGFFLFLSFFGTKEENFFLAVIFCPNRLFIRKIITQSLLTSFLDLSSSQLKLLSNKAKKRLSTIKLPMTKAGKNMAKQDSPTPYKKFTA